MANIGSLAAAGALAQSINSSESAQRDLGTLGVLQQNLERDRKENMMMQELEAAEYEKISEASSQLLERDREKINDKSLKLQADIRTQISNYGSRKKFFEAGGVSLLKKYKSDLLNSPETLRYKDNKTNMERIMQLQAAGRGHLLAPTDLLNMQMYQNGQGEKITYSGLMSEIDYPSEFYEFGKQIPDEAVLRYKDNYTRIYGNYVTENGADSLTGLDQATIDTELLAFMNKMNYTGVGKDEFLRNEQAIELRERRQRQREEVVKSGSDSKDAPQVSWLSEVNNLMNDAIYNKQVGINELLDTNYLASTNNPEVKNYLGDASSSWDLHYKQTATKSGAAFRAIGNVFSSKYFKPASALKLPVTDKEKLSRLIGGKLNEDGTVNYKLTTDMYNANGEKFGVDDVDDYLLSSGGMETEGTAKVLGSFVGFKTADGRILMNVVDKKGKVLKEEDAENRKAYKSAEAESQAKHSIFVALQGDGDEVFYQEVDITTAPGQSQASNILAEADDITKTIKTRNTSKSYSEQATKSIANNRKLIKENLNRASTNDGAFGNNGFINEVQSFKNPNNGSNRDNLIKAYYMAADSFMNDMKPFDAERLKSSTIAEKQFFKKTLTVPGKEVYLGNSLLDYNIGDSTFIKLYTDTYNDDKDMTAEEKERNFAFGKLWNEHFKLIQSNK